MSGASDREEKLTGYSATLSSMGLDETTYRETTSAATALRWQVFASQPFVNEVNRIAFHYIAPGSPHELKLSNSNRALGLYTVQQQVIHQLSLRSK